MEKLRKVICQTGTQSEFAGKIGVSQGALANWLAGKRKVSIRYFDAIEEATQGLVKREDLRPDIFS